jgi:DNA-binding CsgD family transcriptional regulator
VRRERAKRDMVVIAPELLSEVIGGIYGATYDLATGDVATANLQTVLRAARAEEIKGQFQSAQLLASIFAHLSFGVILADLSLRITSLNAAAETILSRANSVLVSKVGHLAAADPAGMAALQRLVAQACGARDGAMPGGGGVLLRARRAGRSPDLALSIEPIRKPLHPVPSVEPHAAIFIRELSTDPPAGFVEQVRDLFGLAPKEARLAVSLASGRTLKEAAEENQIQFSTARSYLEAIFRKTGTRQQSQLVVLLKNVQPLLRR